MGSQSCEDRKTVVPLFKHFLCSLAEKNKPYVYINLLKNTRSKFFDFQRTNEAYRSQALHQLEENKKTLFARSIHVISLPADDKILNGYSLNYSLSTLLKRAVKGISNTDHDFRMSDETKVILFSGTDDVNIRTIIRRLLTLSYYTMHSVSTPLIWDQTLDRKKVKAVWFDFIKLRLTHYIIETFKPIYFNISCKDAIDRAAVHSLYYNKYREDMGQPQSLSSNNSIIDDSSDSETEENTEPLLKTELDLLATKETKLLNYRARLVKDRGINRHGDLYREVDTIRKSIRINTQKHSLYL